MPIFLAFRLCLAGPANQYGHKLMLEQSPAQLYDERTALYKMDAINYDNYFVSYRFKVEDLKHFPYKTFAEFQNVLNNKEAKINIRMDIARRWLLSGDAPSDKRWLITLFSNASFVLTFFYIITGFASGNYFLFIYSLLPVLIFFTYSPLARKAIPVYYIVPLVFLFLLITGRFPSPVYWIPVIITYYCAYWMYEGSADMAEGIIMKNEKALCFFWQWSGLILQKDGINYSQKYNEQGPETHYYEDMKKDWEEYLEMSKQTSSILNG